MPACFYFPSALRRGIVAAALLAVVLQAAGAEPVNPATGTDFASFYAGQLPEVTLAGGGDQSGLAGSTLPDPVAVKVAGGLQNAPVTFTVTSGEALLTATDGANEKPVAVLDIRAVVPIPKKPGDFAAQVYVHVAGKIGSVSTITASVRSGNQSKAVSTPVTVTDPELKSPMDLRLIRNTATTMEIAWTPSDLKMATRIECSYDDGATWKVVGTVPPGTAQTTIYQLVPDHVVHVRVVTVKADGRVAPDRLIAPRR